MNGGTARRVLAGLWRILRWVLVPVALLGAYLLLWPTPLNPYAWTPPKDPGTGPGSPYAASQGLENVSTLGEALIASHAAASPGIANFGPEDVAVSPADHHVYTGIGDGSILRIDPVTGASSVFANTGGRPLGVSFTADGATLYVADAHLGLVSIDPQGKVTLLVNQVAGEPLTFADNLDVAQDGTVWFSAPTRNHSFEQVTLDVWESRPSGRLVRYDPRTGRADKVLDNLFYANGVALAADDSFVLVAEFLGFRIQRYWISGPRAGSHEVFADGLPGYPDNITRTPEGNFLVGLSLGRIAALDGERQHPHVIEMMYRLPPALAQQPAYPALLLELSPEGRVLRVVADETPGRVGQITAAAALPAAPDGGAPQLVLGSLQIHAVRRLPLADARH
jgi:sugar lactone lactonase YvrE